MKHLSCAIILAASSAITHAAPVEATYQDWHIGCDNTNRCEAIGYSVEVDRVMPIALSLARQAGPGTPVVATLIVSDDDPSLKPIVSVSVDTLRIEGLPADKEWPNAQTQTLLPKLLNTEAALVTSGKKRWQLSLAGIKAALLKMDEVQGRLGTPGALVRKGTKPENTVPSPKPVPVLTRAPDSAGGSVDPIPAAILKALPKGDCVEEGSLTGHRLTTTRMLLLQECHRGAYQSFYSVWTANLKPPHNITPVKLPGLKGPAEDGAVEPSYEDGVLSSYGKGRGVNDCGDSTEWLWTAQGFKLLRYDSAPQCRGIPGGVPVRLWTAQKR